MDLKKLAYDYFKKFGRKEKAIYESKNKIGFNSPDIVRDLNSNLKNGVGGRYKNNSTNEVVYLRSTYEWIFAKWLDRTKQNWKVEEKVYILEDGRAYRPDFFIYDNEWNLIKIVEVKGYHSNNFDKSSLLNEMIEIPVCMVTNIKPFLEENTTYERELTKWRKLNED